MRLSSISVIVSLFLHSIVQAETPTASSVAVESAQLNRDQKISDYSAKIARLVRENVMFADEYDKEHPPKVVVEVETDDAGFITGARVIKPSSMPTWDSAVVRGVWRTNRLPPDSSGKVPRNLVLVYTR